METYKQPLKEVLLFASFQLAFMCMFWFALGEKSFLIQSSIALPIASLVMSFTNKKHKWYVNWLKYLLSGALMVLLSFVLYSIQEKYIAGLLGNFLSTLISAIWNFFPGVFKLVASVVILLVVLIILCVFFTLFFLSLLLGNVIFSMWILPKFDLFFEKV